MTLRALPLSLRDPRRGWGQEEGVSKGGGHVWSLRCLWGVQGRFQFCVWTVLA